MIHVLDTLRHYLAVMWTYSAWAGNISGAIVLTVLISALWPRIRHAAEGWFDRKMVSHLETHHARFAALIESHMTQIHTHLDTPKKKQ